MSISKGVQQLPSRIGVLLTLFISTVLIAYTVFKTNIMIEKNGNDMHSTIQEYHYGPDYVMDSSKYFNFAVALTGFDNEQESVLDPSIAELKFIANEWNIYEDGESGFDHSAKTPIESHPCSREELGLTGG